MGFRLRTRFAPTPSGYLHVGNAWSFLLTWLASRSQGGWIHLRIDDLDTARLREEYVEDIFASLRWLGLDWDGGPRDAAEFKNRDSQRLRLNRYREALETLRLRNRVYACVCSREDIRRNSGVSGPAGIYPGTCRELGLTAEAGKHSLRYRVPDMPVRARDENGKLFDLLPHRDMGDFVLRQKSGDPSYQLASLVDDEDLGVNFVVRGLDLMPSTGAQLSLSEALGFTHFSQARFFHHGLMLNNAGEKLSKSAPAAGMRSLQALRGKWPSPAPLYRFFAKRLGLTADGVASASDLLSGFRMDKVPSHPLSFADFARELGD